MSCATLQSRRQIIKSFALLSAASVLSGKRWLSDVLAQIAPPSTQTGGVLHLKLSDFPALAQAGGSVRIGTSGLETVSANCNAPVGLYAPVLINRGPANQFYALNSGCTHEGCIVPIYNSSVGYSQCPKHGSRFGIDGGLRRGPAGAPLSSYAVRFDGADTLAVDIPEMSFDLTSASVQAAGQDRMSLTFLAFFGIEYEVQTRTSLTSNWTAVPFSLTATGPADQTFIAGNSDYATLYVDRNGGSGFYAVAMRTQVV